MMKTRFSSGALYIDAGSMASKLACAYMHLRGAGQGKFHDANELDAGYCIDAPTLLPAGAMYASAERNVWERIEVREGA